MGTDLNGGEEMGGFVGDVLGSISGGIIGESPQEKAEKEARKRQQEAERAKREVDLKAEREKELLKQQEKDIAEAGMATQPDTPKAKPTTTVDFSQSIKAGAEDEDELLKMFRGAGK
ncbi:MAG: hypothetical protein ACRDDY_10820 [Clostridium sp.]|uniref:hypothetical protein n=1 Tax=Clostridium sp. TaxID=1506 RepID=UPI003EE57721